MKQRNLALLGALILGLGVTSGVICSRAIPAWAGEEAGGCLVDKDFELALKKHFEKRFFERIKATDEQKEKISSLIDARMEEAKPLREDLRAGALEFTQLLGSDTSDTTIVDKAHSLREKRDKLMEERLQTLLKVRAILSAEQRKVVSDRLSSIISGKISLRALFRGEAS